MQRKCHWVLVNVTGLHCITLKSDVILYNFLPGQEQWKTLQVCMCFRGTKSRQKVCLSAKGVFVAGSSQNKRLFARNLKDEWACGACFSLVSIRPLRICFVLCSKR